MKEDKVESSKELKSGFKYKIRNDPKFVLILVLSLAICLLILNYPSKQESPSQPNICNIIAATPAWVGNGKLLGYGLNTRLNNTQQLINNNISFYYRDGCGYCDAQIQVFDNWEKYQQSNLTVECP